MPIRPENQLQARIYQVLSGDTVDSGNLQGLLGGAGKVFDLGAVPDTTNAPYVEIGEFHLNDWGSHTTDGFEGEVTIKAWTQSGIGKKDAQQILNRIYQLLHGLDLKLDFFPTVSFRCDFQTVQVDPDNRTYQGIQRYRLTLGGNPAT